MKNINVLITGHTGFKGSWLTVYLNALGANVYGYSLDLNSSPIYTQVKSKKLLAGEVIGNINDESKFKKFVEQCSPDIVFHMAAQPLVIESYEDPIGTLETNVIGTAKVLGGLIKIDSVKAIVVITTDKCYQNKEWCWPYRESDSLGGYDPYSASKACTELVVSSYRDSFFNYENAPLIATARAGNVIGGGDVTKGRLLPDIATSLQYSETLETRNPNATRPWQHVLEPLTGYILLALKLYSGESSAATAWNFGPSAHSNKSVLDVLKIISGMYPSFNWEVLGEPKYHEANLLALDSSKANFDLKWSPVWDVEDSIKYTLQWYLDINSGKDPLEVTIKQLSQYITEVNYDFS